MDNPLARRNVLQLSFEFAAATPEKKQPVPAVDQAPAQNTSPAVDDLDRAYDRASAWSAELADRLGQRVRLIVTDNRSTMLSARPREGRLEVRLHHMFLAAEADLLDTVADYLEHGSRKAARRIDAFIEQHRPSFVAREPQDRLLRTKGRHHDLEAIAQDLADRHFGGELSAKITWGRRVQPKRGQRSLQLGTYLPEERLIRVHPVLDQPWVPRFFVESVVFHEMLHHELPAIVHNGRHRYHTRAFRERERSFECHAAALQWEKENLWRLLRGSQ